MEKVGWRCPGCGKVHGPQVETCPAPVDAVSTKTLPGAIHPMPQAGTSITLPKQDWYTIL